MNIRNALIAAGLTVTVCSAAALSIGDSRGTVVLGAPIDLAFEVHPDPGFDVGSSCIVARMSSGATPIAGSRVQVVPVEGGNPALVRVRAFVNADEPVLTVTLTAGCNGQITRTYTFLAELPGTVAEPHRPVDVAKLTSPVTSSVAASANLSASITTARRAVPTKSRASAALGSTRAPASAPAVRTAKPATAAEVTARSHLVIEPLEIWLESPVELRATSELPAPSTAASDGLRAETAARWKALNTSPEELRDAAAKLSQLEADITAQRAQASRERAAAESLQQRLLAAEEERFSAAVVYGLAGSLLLALALAGWLWNRSRNKAEQDWKRSVAYSASAATDAVARDHAEEPLPGGAQGGGDRWESSESVFSARAPAIPSRLQATIAPVDRAVPVQAPVAPQAPRHPSLDQAPTDPMQIVNPEDLFDIQQQAEFFVSVGEHDQAIDVLKRHIAQHGGISPFAYLELLRLYHTLSRSESFNQLRAQFSEHFNAHIPEFSAFHRMGRLLEEYPEALAAVESEWTTAEVMGIIESLIFKRNGVSPVPPFDMAAFDDLLLLLAIAQTTPASARGAPPPRARTTPIAAPVVAAPLTGFPGVELMDTGNLSMLPIDARALPSDAGKPLAAPSLDSLMGDLSLESLPGSLSLHSGADAFLDLDLSAPPPLSAGDFPPVAVTRPPLPGQPVGFGSENDRLEIRLELQGQNKRNTTES